MWGCGGGSGLRLHTTVEVHPAVAPILVCNSDFRSVTLISGGNPNHFAENQRQIMSQGFYRKGVLEST